MQLTIFVSCKPGRDPVVCVLSDMGFESIILRGSFRAATDCSSEAVWRQTHSGTKTCTHTYTNKCIKI